MINSNHYIKEDQAVCTIQARIFLCNFWTNMRSLNCSTHSPTAINQMLLSPCPIAFQIFMSLYTERSGSRDPEDLLRECNSLHEQIKTWRNSLPPQLEILSSDTDTCVPMPHTLALLYGPPFIFICHLLRALE
jgi:hypothetical protein